ncbi:hypothetical protein BJ170DRAFT_735849 [Xylariales sp. AK1849]|nr:hypothetical protein BJ170DRAFT_735849 [Xylariales sp. AK1849]
MCYRLTELYSTCRCMYYQHAVDRCAAYGRPGHGITSRTILVAYACENHSVPQPFGQSEVHAQPSPIRTLKQTIKQIRENEHVAESETSAVSSSVVWKIRPKEAQQRLLLGGSRSSNSKAEPDSENVKSHAPTGSEVATTADDASEIRKSESTAPNAEESKDQVIGSEVSDDDFSTTLASLFDENEWGSSMTLDLQSLAQDLNAHEDSAKKLSAGKFIERKRRTIAGEICKIFWLPDLDIEIADGDPPELDVIEKELDDANETGLLQNTETQRWFDSVCSSTFTSGIPEGKHRLYYTCQCGQRLHDDYVESRSGALNELKLVLYQYGIHTRASGDLESNASHQTLPVPNGMVQKSKVPRNQCYDFRLPSYWQNQTRAELGKCRRKAAAVQINDKHNYILTCVPFGRLISKLHQPEVCTIDSDQDFFSLLRVTYRKNRTTTPFSFLCRVKAIRFVQFEVYRTGLADIRSHPTLPPNNLSDQYIFDPMPADLMPPIGSNLLVHLLENPTHAGVLPDLYRRIPKKLREKLSPCHHRGASDGWGLAFTEGINTFVYFLCGFPIEFNV